MTSALVGYTGFVGGNLAAQREFSELYNSSNVASIAGRHFDTVVFSAAKAEKWRINQDPEGDLRHIAELEAILRSFTTDRLVLMSTVDVYGDPRGVDEQTPIELDGLHAYGANRYRLEQSAREIHSSVSVLRLPGLFGPGLKKNVIYDLLNDNNVDRINPAGSFQYYNLAHLADDIDTVVGADLDLVNVSAEPVVTGDLASRVFGVELPAVDAPAGSYDMRSIHADLFGGSDGYLYSRTQTLDELSAFVAAEQAR